MRYIRYKSSNAVGLRCEKVSMEGLFLKGVKGLNAQYNPRAITITGGQNILIYDVKVILEMDTQ